MKASIRRAPLALQVAAMVAAGPVAIGVVGLLLVPLVARSPLVHHDPEMVGDVTTTVRMVLALAVAIGALTAAAAGAILRSSIGSAIDAMRRATEAISGGSFAHRIDVRRSDELGALADAINAMATRLEGLEAGRRRMLASVSHELRTPLTIIRGHAFTLARQAEDGRLRDRLELIEEETMRLTALVDDLLDAATIHAGGARLQRCCEDLLAVVAGSVDRFADEAARCGVALELEAPDAPMAVDVDQDRIHQALGNLLANAMAHAPRGSTVEVAVAGSSGGDSPGWQVAVRNGGAGIPEALQASLFEPFVQGPRSTGRVGLGLSIARDIAAAHGGSLTCSSMPGLTEFVLALPRAAVAVARAPRMEELGTRYAEELAG